jgi:hypothetical protein
MLDPFGREYLRLTLEIDRHIEGYVDAYIGPPELKAEVAGGEKLTPQALRDKLAWLQDHIPAADPDRQAYLAATLQAMDCTIGMLSGQEYSFLDEVGRLFDVEPALVDEGVFLAAHRELDELLPGRGRLADRVQARREAYELQPEQVLPLLELAREATRERTAALIDLPAGEGVEVRLTSSQPWSAYNWFQGNGRSLIEFNTDIPVSALSLLNTFAHEGYPGHHTEGVLKEKHLYQERGWAEAASFLLQSPAAVISEGIATTAAEIIFPGRQEYEWLVEELLPAAGIQGESPELLERVARASEKLYRVSGNVAILYYAGQLNKEQALDYLQTYGLSTPERAAKSLNFVTLYRAYVFTYTAGYDLIKKAAAGRSKWPLFRRLLDEPVLPSQLAAMAASTAG